MQKYLLKNFKGVKQYYHFDINSQKKTGNSIFRPSNQRSASLVAQ